MSNKINEKNKDFNPNDVGLTGTLFGLPEVRPDDAEVVVVSVPWDVTTSYRPGTSKAPQAVVDASSQIDFYLPEINDPTSIRYAVTNVLDDEISELNGKMRPKAEQVICALEEGREPEDPELLNDINSASGHVNQWVYEVCRDLLAKGKTVVLLGGDHSTPLGFMEALAEKHENFGILHLDAHADLRVAYEGFKYSHASIMYNAIEEIPEISKLVQVGIRDFSQAEVDYAQQPGTPVLMYPYEEIFERIAKGCTWNDIVERMVAKLPKHVYISFDIDGLKQEYCPSTGTPVPGGLEYQEAIYLIQKVMESGRTIIGADLNEVGYNPDNEWDAVVGMRILFRLCALSACSQGKLKSRTRNVRL